MSLLPPISRSIAVLISGGGTTLKNLIEHRRQGKLNVEIASVISNTAAAGGLAFATEAGIPTVVIDHTKSSTAEFSQQVFVAIEASGAQWVVLGGFLRRLVIEPNWLGRIINIHPSLIPAFAGRGFYGHRVHEAVLEFGCKISGCTVHFVDNEYDHGPIIAQLPVEVRSDDTPQTLAQRVFAAECRLYPATVNALAAGSIRLDNRHVTITPPLRLN